jgi:hypothetical protein
LYLDKFNPEVQLFSGHLMVGIQCDIDIILFSDCDRERLSHHVTQIDTLADIEIFRAGQSGDLDGDDEKEDPGDISGINDIYEAMYKKINVFLNSMLTTQAYAHFFMKNYKRDKMENYPD